MAINFPNSPTAGSTYTYQGITYTWIDTSGGGGAAGYWKVNTTGSIGIATGAEVDIGTDNAKYVTPLAMEDSSYVKSSDVLGGAGQAWQDVKSSRAEATVYTNSTGRPILVSITVNPNTTVGKLEVDGVAVAQHYDGTNSNIINHAMSTVVPAGSTYELTYGGDSIILWAELR
tara:strand:- start:270 stop:788 length:519 start_codon:yes stop_codon:yes gene_type:complete